MPTIARALVSVSDKTGLVDFCRGLSELGVELISTGGTARLLSEAGLPVRQISDYTGFPEMMDGRVKTLHPKVHGGLLALRDNPEHVEAARRHGIEMIDLVVVNLYPFEETISRPGVTLEQAVEQIDIGGPSMLRSAAKNHRFVGVICNPERYPGVLEELRRSRGKLSEPTCASLAVEVFRHTSRYDAMIAGYLADQLEAAVSQPFPARLSWEWEKVTDLRYGENPHQQAAFYRAAGSNRGLVAARQLHGKALSYNNLLDLDAGAALVSEFDLPAAGIIKHNVPCGAALGTSGQQAFLQAHACDPVSAFGGVVALNCRVDLPAAQAISGSGFLEAVIAPGFDPDALELLSQKKDVRLLELPEPGPPDPYDFRRVEGGLLVQDRDTGQIGELRTVTKLTPSPQQLETLRFAWKVVKHVRSNAIVLAQDGRTVGIGPGQTSRVESVTIAARKAGDLARGSALASDAFFPKPDGVEEAARAGVAVIAQPGGSISDQEVIEACDRLGLAMVFTGLRHFKH